MDNVAIIKFVIIIDQRGIHPGLENIVSKYVF